MKRAWRFALLAFVLLVAASAFARPGGGQSFSGGSRSSGSSYSGGSRSSGSSYSGGGSSYSGGSYYSSGGGGSASMGSVIGSILFFVIVAIVVNLAKSKMRGSGWTAGHSGMNTADFFPQPPQAPPRPQVSGRKELERLREFDPGFSLVVFDDFISALYAEILLARGKGELQKFTAYLSPGAAQWLGQRPLDGLTHVLVGALSVHAARGLEPTSQRVTVEVDVESNLAKRDPQSGQEQALYVKERWTLSRAKTAKSRTPDKSRVFACPNCGAPLTEIFGGKCRHCGQNVASGAFDWVVDSIFVETTESRGPMLTGNTAEQGNDAPTVFDPTVQQGFAQLQQKDPALQWEPLSARINLIFQTFQRAWSGRDLATMRPFLSDALFTTQSYWVGEYLRQGLQNVTENAQLHGVELSRVTTDAFFDAITVRVWASSLDFTVNQSGAVVAGNRSTPRRYTEYWTLIRSSRAKGPPKTDSSCPRCGAPLNVNMGGSCNYCQAKVTTGDFDWVLSRIEQDDVYVG